MRTAESLLDDVLSLPRNERAKLALALSSSLEPNDAVDTDVQAEWLDLALRRLDELNSGVVQAVSLKDAIDELTSGHPST